MEKLINQLKRHEGFRSTPYRCTAGKWSIGYGLNLEDNGISVGGIVLNESIAELILRSQVREIIDWLYHLDYTYEIYPSDDQRLYACANMVFNLGRNGFLKFKKMLRAIEVGDYETASKEMLNSRWAKQVGSRATELAEQMRTGEWQF